MPTKSALLGLSLVLTLRPLGLAQQPVVQAPGALDDASAHDVFVRVCTKCHPAERATAEGRSRAQWEATIISMQTARGAVITPDEFDVVLEYLSKHFGRQSIVIPGGAGAAGEGAGHGDPRPVRAAGPRPRARERPRTRE